MPHAQKQAQEMEAFYRTCRKVLHKVPSSLEELKDPHLLWMRLAAVAEMVRDFEPTAQRGKLTVALMRTVVERQFADLSAFEYLNDYLLTHDCEHGMLVYTRNQYQLNVNHVVSALSTPESADRLVSDFMRTVQRRLPYCVVYFSTICAPYGIGYETGARRFVPCGFYAKFIRPMRERGGERLFCKWGSLSAFRVVGDKKEVSRLRVATTFEPEHAGEELWYRLGDGRVVAFFNPLLPHVPCWSFFDARVIDSRLPPPPPYIHDLLSRIPGPQNMGAPLKRERLSAIFLRSATSVDVVLFFLEKAIKYTAWTDSLLIYGGEFVAVDAVGGVVASTYKFFCLRPLADVASSFVRPGRVGDMIGSLRKLRRLFPQKFDGWVGTSASVHDRLRDTFGAESYRLVSKSMPLLLHIYNRHLSARIGHWGHDDRYVADGLIKAGLADAAVCSEMEKLLRSIREGEADLFAKEEEGGGAKKGRRRARRPKGRGRDAAADGAEPSGDQAEAGHGETPMMRPEADHHWSGPSEERQCSRPEVDPARAAVEGHGDECVVCMNATACFASLPCGHLCLCGSCREAMRGDLCVVCRQPSTLLRIFRP